MEEEAAAVGTSVPHVVTPPPAEDEAAAFDPNDIILHGLHVLPPRQQQTDSSEPLPALALPLIRPEEPVQSIRAALAEVLGLSQITNYRLELESEGPSEKTIPWKAELISPYTGMDAVVSIPVSTKSLDEKADLTGCKNVLDEWSDLSPLLEQGLKSGSAFRMVLQRYDLALVKDHLVRLRSLLHGSAPSVLAIMDEEYHDKDEDSKEEEEAVAATVEEKTPEKPHPDLPEYPGKVDGRDLKHFFYLASGEDVKMYHDVSKQESSSSPKAKKKKKPRQPNNGGKDSSDGIVPEISIEQELREKMPRWNELEDLCRVDCRLGWSGFHPPPPYRKWMGDLAYLELTPPAGAPVIHVTATRTGFYINRSSTEPRKPIHFDPSPATEPCFSHSLLDCLLQASTSFRDAWARALQASKERVEILNKLNKSCQFLSLFRIAVRSDFKGFASPASAAAAAQSLDATLQTPSWLVPCPSEIYYNKDDSTGWTRCQHHQYEPARAEEDLSSSFGVDLRSGGIRDWNEELQLARGMPISTQVERIERGRLLYKISSEFGEAALAGVKAISEGQVTPMNPNETIRTQVYLHNNIFFSRAIDAGPETFKFAKGDRAAHKLANRDLQCNSFLHRMEKSGISTLATVLIDYLGNRFVCQSILPGILIGERAHKLLLGAVESGVPLKWDKDLHELLESRIGQTLMVATRPVLRYPLTQERLEEIKKQKKDLPAIPDPPREEKDEEEEEEQVDPDAIMMTCVPMEAKGIIGSDKRRYLLDLGRLTPRDANWIPKEKGGTGNWEAWRKENGKTSTVIPSTLEDDEWTMCCLRPELVTKFTQVHMVTYLRDKKEKKAEKNKESGKAETQDVVPSDMPSDKKQEAKATEIEDSEKPDEDNDKLEETEDTEREKLSEEDLDHLKTLRLNVNVFLPDMRSFEGINDEAAQQQKQDEQRVRDASNFLWEQVLPRITKLVKDRADIRVHQLPVDGRTLTEFLHRNGINCRYLGRLALLAQQYELKDAKTTDDLKHGRQISFEGRRTMPKYWLELIECEMVARAAKHVLDSYFIEHGGAAASQPAQTIASFLSAVVSESEETAAQTEARLEKRRPNEPDEDDFGSLTICDSGGDGDALPSPIRSRSEVWQDIELEIGRRFRYTLTLFNTGNKAGRARHIPLLRRLCQRTGVRLLAKSYDVGGKCLCSGGSTFGGRLTGSYPVSPVDIVDVVPLMKHAAAHNEGFYPCSMSPVVTLPPLQVSLQDARLALERAHIQTDGRALNRGLELAQEALSLYQRVTESPTHPCVIETMELMATIFTEGGDLPQAVSYGEKALSLAMQTCGFDAPNVAGAHLTLFQMQYAAKEADRAVKHLRAALYLYEIMAGPDHIENFTSYHRYGNIYNNADDNGRHISSALKCFEDALKVDSGDRLMEGITLKNFAQARASLGDYKDALESEKQANTILTLFLGKAHHLVKESFEDLEKYEKLAAEKGNRTTENDKMREEAARADAAAADLMAAEEQSAKQKKNKKKKSKK